MSRSRNLRVQKCGHPTSNWTRSVESGAGFCLVCQLNDTLNDAVSSERRLLAERDALRRALGDMIRVYVRDDGSGMEALAAARALMASTKGE